MPGAFCIPEVGFKKACGELWGGALLIFARGAKDDDFSRMGEWGGVGGRPRDDRFGEAPAVNGHIDERFKLKIAAALKVIDLLHDHRARGIERVVDQNQKPFVANQRPYLVNQAVPVAEQVHFAGFGRGKIRWIENHAIEKFSCGLKTIDGCEEIHRQRLMAIFESIHHR